MTVEKTRETVYWHKDDHAKRIFVSEWWGVEAGKMLSPLVGPSYGLTDEGPEGAEFCEKLQDVAETLIHEIGLDYDAAMFAVATALRDNGYLQCRWEDSRSGEVKYIDDNGIMHTANEGEPRMYGVRYNYFGQECEEKFATAAEARAFIAKGKIMWVDWTVQALMAQGWQEISGADFLIEEAIVPMNY